MAGAGGKPTERIIMDNLHPKKHGGDIRVNLAGIDPDLAKDEVIATLSLLSEGETFCDECGERIDELAVYVSRPRPHLRHGYEVVAIVHRECYSGDVA